MKEITSIVISQSSLDSHGSVFLNNSQYTEKQCKKNQGTVITLSQVYNKGHSEHAIPNSSVFYNIELEN